MHPSMKRFIQAAFLALTHLLFAQQVSIPDTQFLKALIKEGVDVNQDSIIQLSEAQAVHFLNVSYDSISDLSGIQSFTNLDTLICIGNLLSSLDMGSAPHLKKLDCYYNPLTTLEIRQCPALSLLNCYANRITFLDITQNKALTWLQMGKNFLSALDVSQNTQLTFLECTFNSLTTLDVNQNAALRTLLVSSNSLQTLDISQNTQLEVLNCASNQLESLQLGFAPELYNLDCSDNHLSTLDISTNAKMDSLSCQDNPNLARVCLTPSQADQEFKWKKDPDTQWDISCGTPTGLDDEVLLPSKLVPARILNIQGSEVSPQEALHGLFIYQYGNGTTKKVLK